MANEFSVTDTYSSSSESSLLPRTLSAVGSDVELVLTVGVVICCTVSVLVGNAIFFTAVFKNRQLQTAHYFLLCSYAICDVGQVLTGCITCAMVLYHGTDTPQWACRLFSCMVLAPFFSSVYMVGLIAYERYHFFCRPMSYDRVFTPRTLLSMVAGVWAIVMGYLVFTEIFIGRTELVLTTFMCQVEKSEIAVKIPIICFLGPSVCLVLFSTIRVAILRAKLSTTVVVPQGVIPQSFSRAAIVTTNHANESSSRLKWKVNKALKLIFLISGLFWGTYLPGFIFRVIILSSNITFEEIDSRQNMTAMILLRSGTWLLCIVSPVLNPWVYMYTHSELRTTVEKMTKICHRVQVE